MAFLFSPVNRDEFIGKRTIAETLIRNKTEIYHNVPIFVLRKATFEEYKNWVLENNGKPISAVEIEFIKAQPEQHFYEISMD